MNQYQVTVTFETVVGHNDPSSAVEEACVTLKEEFGGSRQNIQITEVRARLVAAETNT